MLYIKRKTIHIYLLNTSILLALSIMYQIYFVDFSDGVIVGGARWRFLFKVVFVMLFILSLREYLSWRAFKLNLFYKLPLFFICSTIIIFSPFLNSAYLQSLNLLFFMPIFFIDWNNANGEYLYAKVWRTVAIIVLFQLILDAFLLSSNPVGWSNGAYVGGMGNPNVFGLFLIVSGLVFLFFYSSKFHCLAALLFLASPLTGSLVVTITGFVCLTALMIFYFFNGRLVVKVMIGFVFLVGMCFSQHMMVDTTSGISHVFVKLKVLSDLFVDNNIGGSSLSFTARSEYWQNGIDLIVNHPVAVITGHPGFLPMYNGDGLWVSFYVSYGFLAAPYFLVVNLMLLFRGFKSHRSDFIFSSFVLLVMLIFFVANRILDYWPAALLYIMAFSYLSTKNIVRSNKSTLICLNSSEKV